MNLHPIRLNTKWVAILLIPIKKRMILLKKIFILSPIFTGHIKGTPPRYCPSIEDKISRFADKTSHHVFVEPESASSEEMYPNGLSTSLAI